MDYKSVTGVVSSMNPYPLVLNRSKHCWVVGSFCNPSLLNPRNQRQRINETNHAKFQEFFPASPCRLRFCQASESRIEVTPRVRVGVGKWEP